MRKLNFLILTGILSFTLSCGQQKRYVAYKVQEGETMSDIAQRSDMSLDDLLRLNPDVDKNPEVNTVIVIPNPKVRKNISSDTSKFDETNNTNEGNSQIEQSNQTNNSELENDSLSENYQTTVIKSYETHKVLAGETVYRITKKYGITKENLIKLNPEFPDIKSNTLSIGQVLKVKAVEEIVTINKEEVLKQYLTHTVKSKETIFSLTRYYNVTKEELIKLNPEFPDLVDNKLSIGQLLKIKPIEKVKDTDAFVFYQDTIQENAAVKLALLLPFRAKEYDTVPSKQIFKSKLANMVTDFYMGTEIAIDSIKKQGIQVDLAVFDTGKKGRNITEILSANALDSVDVVIGPFYSEKANLVAKEVNTSVIFPNYSKNLEKLSSSRLIKSAPEKSMHLDYLSNYLKENYNGETILIVGDNQDNSKKSIDHIISSLKKHDSISAIHIITPDVEDGYIKKERFTDKMSQEKPNWVIFTSDDKVVVADALNSMIGLPDEIAVQVFTTDKNKAYNETDNNKLAKINFTFVSNTFIDNQSDDVKLFFKKFKSRNHALPSEYAIKGFDITYDILMRLASGKNLNKTFKKGISLRVENKFDYHKKIFGSTSNHGLFMVKYNRDLSLSRLK